MLDVKNNKTGEASAATNYIFHGQAWSPNVGWISFNCLEGSSTGSSVCATSNYAVKTKVDGEVYGNAWNEHLGWISFNAADVAGCPTGTGCTPKLTASGLTGFARVKSMIGLPASQAGGWNGFIDLSKVTRDSGTPANFTGSMWSDDVLGTASMNCVDGSLSYGSVCATSNYKVYLETRFIPDPILNFTISKTIMKPNNSAIMNWTATNVDSCTASGDWSGARALNGNVSMGVLTTEKTYVYTLTCKKVVDEEELIVSATRNLIVTSTDFCGDGVCNTSCGATLCGSSSPTPETRSVSNVCPQDCTSDGAFTANPKFTKTTNATSTLKWNLTGAQNCKLYDYNGTMLLQNIANGTTTGSRDVNVTTKQTYSIRCDGSVYFNTTVAPYLLYES